MRQLKPILWTKGTFLSPQHLQTQDNFIQSAMQFHLEALNFRPWGFVDVRIKHEALTEGNFALSRAVGIFPDGMAFDIPASDPAPAPKPLAPFFDAEQQSIDVYLAIPSGRENGLNVSTPAQGADTRFFAEDAEIRDENTGAGVRAIQMGRKNFKLLVEGESREGSVTLKVARIRRTAAGTFEADTTFVPPLLNLAASEYCISLLRRLVEILSAKSGILADKRRQKSQGLADFTSSDIANFWLLYTVNNYFPVLRHIYETRRGHPENAFRILTALAGSLTTFSMKIQPRDLPAYDHDDLGACLTDLDEKVRELLETVVPSNSVSLPLKLVQPSIYATSIDDDRYLVNTKMFLAVASEMPEIELIKRAAQIKVGSASQLDQLIRMALPGIPLTHLPKPPGAIPVKLAFQYFALKQSGPAWDSIGKARNLGAYVPAEIPNPQLELIILLPQAI